MPESDVRVLLVCSGIGIMNRGIESFFWDAFHGLRHHSNGLKLRLVTGAGAKAEEQYPVWNLPRTGLLAKVLGALARRNGYVVEQWSSFPGVARQIRAFRPQVVFYSDANLGFLLFWLRKQLGVPFRLLFSNGGPVNPPFVRTDYVHQVAPCHYLKALREGEPAEKHFMVPYGINLVGDPELLSGSERSWLRQKLGLPVDRPVVLSVGWVRREHKRMDYVIEEIARLPEPRPYLQLVGAIDEGSREILALGGKLLGTGGFGACSVPYSNIFDFYRAADCFVLGSIREGFGRVYLEALMHGLPVIAHRNPITEFVLASEGVLGDLSRPEALARLIIDELKTAKDEVLRNRRWATVRDRFSWPVLAGNYREMFEICARSAGRAVICRLRGERSSARSF